MNRRNNEDTAQGATWTRKGNLILYPFLFAMAPVLGLYADNTHEVYLSDLLRPLLCSAGITLLVVLISIPLAKGAAKAGLPSLLFVLFVFAYGPVIQLLSVRLRSRYLLPTWSALWLAAYVAAVVYMRRTKRNLGRLTGALNLVGGVVALVPVLLAVPAWYSSKPGTRPELGGPLPIRRSAGATRASAELPDIYFIILDGYAREDILRDRFGYDNSPFIEALRKKGFYVADKATSNYMHTHLSLSATLQLTYLDQFLRDLGGVDETKEGWFKASRYFYRLVRESYVHRYLEARGYRAISYDYITKSFDTKRPQWTFLSEFELVLLGKTVLAPLLKFWPPEPLSPHDLRRKSIREAFRQIPAIVQEPGPKFVYLHIVCPHSPFVFKADGSNQPVDEAYRNALWFPDASKIPGWQDRYRTRYPQQVQGVNIYVEKAVDDILARSARPPIIILQGDHGPALGLSMASDTCDVQERAAILNAIYFPDGATSRLYAGISSVNTFRIILSQYFGEDLPLLPDRNYHSGLGLRLTDVTDRVRGHGDGRQLRRQSR